MDPREALRTIQQLTQQGRETEAIDLAKALVTGNPEYAPAWHTLGMIYKNRGDITNAIDNITRATEQPSPSPTYYKDLADLYRAKGDLLQAKQNYQNAIALNPDYFQAHANLGNILLDLNEIESAISHHEKALSLHPEIAELYDNLGNALRMARRPSEAIALYDKALKLKPSLISAELNKGLALIDLALPVEALESLNRVLQKAPNIPEAHAAAANCMQHLNHPKKAREHIAVLKTLEPGSKRTALIEAGFLADQDEFEAAYTVLEPYIELCKSDFSVAHTYGILAKKSGGSNAIQEDLRLFLKSNPPPAQNEIITFLLGDLYNIAGEYEKAFIQYEAANKLVAAKFDRDAYTKRVNRVISVFSSDNLALLPRCSTENDTPTFLTGTSRSGKSLIEQILACHPDVAGQNERDIFKELIPIFRAQTQYEYPYGILQCSQSQLNRLATDYLEMFSAGDSKRVINTIPGNLFYLGLVNLLSPKARIIHVQRNPLDVSLECFFRHYDNPFLAHADLLDHGFIYRETQRLMDHWRETLENPILTVSYETLVDRPGETIGRILDFLNLDWDDRCLNFHQPGAAKLSSARTTTRPLSTENIGLWKRYEPFIQPLIEQQRSYGLI